MAPTRPRRLLLALAAAAIVAVGGLVLLTRPLPTLQGVNYRVSVRTIPAYAKILDFLQRHYQYKSMAARICATGASDADCALAIFDWTHANIRPTPEGWPVVDDHPVNIAIRGYGKADQMADLFATLTVYAGIPAFFNFVKAPGSTATLPLAFAYIDGKWVTFDVDHHIVFRNRDGQLADVEELAADPAWVDEATAGIMLSELPYSRFVSRDSLMPFTVPDPLRSQLQQPWPRVRYELRNLTGLERD